MRLPLSALLAAATLWASACDGGPAGPDGPPVAALEILRNGVPVTALSMVVEEEARLTAATEGADGARLTGRRVRWSSDNPAVARVDTAGVVEALAPGVAVLRAEAEGKADRVTLTVENRDALAELRCAPGEAPLHLEVGEVVTTDARAAQVVCLGGGAGAEYVLVPFNATTVPGGTMRVEMSGVGMGEVRALQLDGASRLLPGAPAPRSDDAFHLRLRDAERRDLPGLRVPPGDAAFPSSLAPQRLQTAAEPAIGDLLRLNVSATACRSPDRRTGRVEAITEHAVVVTDTANPPGGFTREELRALGGYFDSLVWPLNTRVFGEPTDIDGNGRVVLFFTRAVNELTASGSTQLTQGFFFARDLFPTRDTRELRACEGSNAAEMFYLLVPDPEGRVNGNVRSKESVSAATVSVLAHEFQHLVSASRRLHLLGTGNFLEEVWLNEGMSHIAEELLFYEVSGLEPRSDLTGDDLAAAAALDEFYEHQYQNFSRLAIYLGNPEGASLMGQDELPTRGASWAFLRYAADREPGPDEEFLYDLANSTRTGVENLAHVLGASPLEWMQDWTVAVLADDTPLEVLDRFRQPSWNFRAAMAALPSIGRYPLRLHALDAAPRSEEEFVIQQGGAAFLFLRLAGEEAAVRTTSAGAPAPSSLRLSIVRVR